MDHNHNQELTARTNDVVLKRLKFIFKIIKALTVQPNTRNRQVHVYVLEVVDAVSDWIGNQNSELQDLLDKQIYPQICRLITTLSKDEFNMFQRFFVKFVLVKWPETSNFLALEFLSDIYGFIVTIAPDFVVEEYIEVFTQESMPPQITLVILPAVIVNLTDKAANRFSDKLTVFLSFPILPKAEITSIHLQQIVRFWKYVGSSTKISLRKFVPLLPQCILTLDYIYLLQETDLEIVLESIRNMNTNPVIFLLLSAIFLPAMCCTEYQPSPTIRANIIDIIDQVVNVVKICGHPVLGIFAMKVLQRFMEECDVEYNIDSLIPKIANMYNINITENGLISNVEDNSEKQLEGPSNALTMLEASVKRIINADSSGAHTDADRKRIKLMIEHLEKIC